jgi:hypothetical protein
MTLVDERRQYPRFSADGLNVALKTLSGAEVDPDNPSVVPLDFNQFGLSVLSQHNFQIGEAVSLHICEENGSVLDVNGVIKSRTKKGESFRFGVAFDFRHDAGEHLLVPSLSERELQVL